MRVKRSRMRAIIREILAEVLDDRFFIFGVAEGNDAYRWGPMSRSDVLTQLEKIKRDVQRMHDDRTTLAPLIDEYYLVDYEAATQDRRITRNVLEDMYFITGEAFKL